MYVQVAIADIIYKIDKLYDYQLTEPVSGSMVGRRVYVPFGSSNALHKGLVISEREEPEYADNIKKIHTVLDAKPVVSSEQLELIEFMHSQYSVPRYQAMKLMIPQGLDYSLRRHYTINEQFEDKEKYTELWESIGSKKKICERDIPQHLLSAFNDAIAEGAMLEHVVQIRGIGDLAEKWISLQISLEQAEEYFEQLPKRYQAQKDVLALLFDQPQWPVKEVMYLTGCSLSTIQTLIKKEWIKVYYQPILRDPYANLPRKSDTTPLQLTQEQKQVSEELIRNLDSNGSVHLLHGVTGSGKTFVFMQLIDEVIASEKSVMFLVPEISLTPQMVRRFFMRYGQRVAVMHSGLSMGERLDEWKRIREAKCSIVIGTRSAVFAPIQNLGLIIIDEEHEPSYKSDSSPRYHAKDVARFLAKQSGALLLLASATPSIESYRATEKGKWQRHVLTKRYNQQPLPEVMMVDMRQEDRTQGDGFLSEKLRTQLEKTLLKKEQAILFLNRRGTHTIIRCADCGYVHVCPNCGISMTYHSKNDRCVCHYCGYSTPTPKECPVCHRPHVRMMGMGTQLVEQKLKEVFPSARILRMDMDTVMSHRSYQQMLGDFENKQYDILLGTQMVAKGLDFPNVTLVGVLHADMSLYIEDFRAGERTFSMLTQVCGRCGRADKPGQAIIQTYCPEHEVLYYAKKQDYASFYHYEIQFRKAILYPPFCDLALFCVSAPTLEMTQSAAAELFDNLHQLSQQQTEVPIRLLCPCVPRIAKSGGRFRMHLIIKCKNNTALRKILCDAMNKVQKGRVRITVDINPLNFS